jgi:hypothetical protein
MCAIFQATGSCAVPLPVLRFQALNSDKDKNKRERITVQDFKAEKLKSSINEHGISAPLY